MTLAIFVYLVRKVNLALLFSLLFFSNIVLAQPVTIQGKIIDGKSKFALAGVSVTVGALGTSTDKQGNFRIEAELPVLINKGIRFSCVGYTKQRLLYQPNHFYEVELFENTTALKEVVIGDVDNIIRKACKNIGKNYPEKPTLITGILRDQITRNRSDYFKSDAIIKAYVPPYLSNEKTSVMMVQNKIDSIKDKSLRYLRTVGEYNIVAYYDVAHNKPLISGLSKMRKYDYTLAGKQLYKNHKVYVINVTLKDTDKVNNQIDAILYIDTATYAFVAANITRYNVIRIGFVKTAKANYTVDYREIAQKWYLDEIHYAGQYEYSKEAPTKNIDFICTKIDSTNVSPLQYKDIIQDRDNTRLISKEGDKNQWSKYDSLFVDAENNNRMGKISNTALDTIKQRNLIDNSPAVIKAKNSFSRRALNYIAHGNVEEVLALAKLPVNITNGISNSVNYGKAFSLNFRVRNNLFFGYETVDNLGNNKHVDVAEIAFNVSNEFTFNKNAHAITLTPYLGYEILTISLNTHEVDYNTLEFGLHTSLELTHRKALFLSSGYNTATGNRNLDGLNIMPTHYTVAFGIMFKI